MTHPNEQPHSPELSPAELERLQMLRKSIAEELPDLIARDQLQKEARDERSISGSLRDAIHRSDVPLAVIATQAGLTPIQLDEFLTGERTLRSDILDRLAALIGYEIPPARAGA